MVSIYLDVDGVINAVSRKPPRNNTQWSGEWGHEIIEGFPILWSKELVDGLNKLAERSDVEIKWLTTWQGLAATSLSPIIGLQGIEWYFFVPDISPEEDIQNLDSWWKLRSIRNDIAETKPDKVVWIDDDIRVEKNALQWVADSSDTPILSISPNSMHGMTKKHLRDIMEFIDS